MFYCSDGWKSLLLLLCFENGNMKRMLSFDKHSHISTIRVKFEWTKHIRRLKPKPMKEIFKIYKKTFAQYSSMLVQLKVSKLKIKLIKTLELSPFWRNQRYSIAHHKENLIWIDDEMKTKGTQGQFTIDRRTIALDTDELLFEPRC